MPMVMRIVIMIMMITVIMLSVLLKLYNKIGINGLIENEKNAENSKCHVRIISVYAAKPTNPLIIKEYFPCNDKSLKKIYMQIICVK